MSGYSKKRKTMKDRKENLRTYQAQGYLTPAPGPAYYSGFKVSMDIPANANTITGGRVTNEGKPNVVVVNQIPSSVSSGQSRSGRSSLMKSIAIKGAVEFGATAEDSIANLFLVYDRDSTVGASGTIPSAFVADILDYSTIGGTTVVPSVPQSNISNAPRFKIIKHWAFQHPQLAATLTIPIDEFISLKDKEVVFKADDATGNYASMVRGALYLVGYGDGTTGTTSSVGFVGTTRLYFQEC